HRGPIHPVTLLAERRCGHPETFLAHPGPIQRRQHPDRHRAQKPRHRLQLVEQTQTSIHIQTLDIHPDQVSHRRGYHHSRLRHPEHQPPHPRPSRDRHLRRTVRIHRTVRTHRPVVPNHRTHVRHPTNPV